MSARSRCWHSSAPSICTPLQTRRRLRRTVPSRRLPPQLLPRRTSRSPPAMSSSRHVAAANARRTCRSRSASSANASLPRRAITPSTRSSNSCPASRYSAATRAIPTSTSAASARTRSRMTGWKPASASMSMASIMAASGQAQFDLVDLDRIEVLRGPARHVVRQEHHRRRDQCLHEAPHVHARILWRGRCRRLTVTISSAAPRRARSSTDKVAVRLSAADHAARRLRPQRLHRTQGQQL